MGTDGSGLRWTAAATRRAERCERVLHPPYAQAGEQQQRSGCPHSVRLRGHPRLSDNIQVHHCRVETTTKKVNGCPVQYSQAAVALTSEQPWSCRLVMDVLRHVCSVFECVLRCASTIVVLSPLPSPRDCEHTSERIEPFLVLTAEVQVCVVGGPNPGAWGGAGMPGNVEPS